MSGGAQQPGGARGPAGCCAGRERPRPAPPREPRVRADRPRRRCRRRGREPGRRLPRGARAAGARARGVRADGDVDGAYERLAEVEARGTALAMRDLALVVRSQRGLLRLRTGDVSAALDEMETAAEVIDDARPSTPPSCCSTSGRCASSWVTPRGRAATSTTPSAGPPRSGTSSSSPRHGTTSGTPSTCVATSRSPCAPWTRPRRRHRTGTRPSGSSTARRCCSTPGC